MDQKHISLPLRDLSKMFDSVNHLIFLKKILKQCNAETCWFDHY